MNSSNDLVAIIGTNLFFIFVIIGCLIYLIQKIRASKASNKHCTQGAENCECVFSDFGNHRRILRNSADPKERVIFEYIHRLLRLRDDSALFLLSMQCEMMDDIAYRLNMLEDKVDILLGKASTTPPDHDIDDSSSSKFSSLEEENFPANVESEQSKKSLEQDDPEQEEDEASLEKSKITQNDSVHQNTSVTHQETAFSSSKLKRKRLTRTTHTLRDPNLFELVISVGEQ